MNKKSIFEKIIGVLLVLFIASLAIKVGSTAPDNAVVYVDNKDGTFFPEVYLPSNSAVGFMKTTYQKAKEQNLEVKDGMDDFYVQRNLFFDLLSIPIWSESRGGFHFQNRWDDDGTWNW